MFSMPGLPRHEMVMSAGHFDAMRAFLQIACWSLSTLLLSACSGNKPKKHEIFLMPAPEVYEAGSIDPFADNDPMSRGVPPGVLFATDRTRAEPPTRKFPYYTDQRGNALRLGLARIQLGYDASVSWEEVRRISLRRDRTEKYPLQITSVEDFGLLAATIRPWDNLERSPEPGKVFAEAIDARLAASDLKDVFVYVHGYKVNFENPVLVAAELWHFLGYQGAFVAYSWPATYDFKAYFSDIDDAMNSARYLRQLILFIAQNTRVERIHLIGYSAGTRLVSRMLTDLGMYAYAMDLSEVDRRVRLGNVILIGSDVDREVFTGYLLDGVLRVPDSLTVYGSRGDGALRMAERVFGGRRAGQIDELSAADERVHQYFLEHPELRVIDVTDASDSLENNGHSYFRTSPWVSSDLLMTLLYDLEPGERGLIRAEELPIWTFPPDYIDRLRSALQRKDQTSASDPNG
jgi:hypothetical protein